MIRSRSLSGCHTIREALKTTGFEGFFVSGPAQTAPDLQRLHHQENHRRPAQRNRGSPPHGASLPRPVNCRASRRHPPPGTPSEVRLRACPQVVVQTPPRLETRLDLQLLKDFPAGLTRRRRARASSTALTSCASVSRPRTETDLRSPHVKRRTGRPSVSRATRPGGLRRA